jgi:hypothetical protein
MDGCEYKFEAFTSLSVASTPAEFKLAQLELELQPRTIMEMELELGGKHPTLGGAHKCVGQAVNLSQALLAGLLVFDIGFMNKPPPTYNTLLNMSISAPSHCIMLNLVRGYAHASCTRRVTHVHSRSTTINFVPRVSPRVACSENLPQFCSHATI